MSRPQVGLRYDLRGAGAATHRELYAAAIEQVRFADARGFEYVRLNEHHGAQDGYCPSPLVLGSALAAASDQVTIRITALILPLHDPIRAAEDLAVLDLISGGRLEVVVGAGYLDQEFAMFGLRLDQRVERLEYGIGVLRKAWTGEEFEHAGTTLRVRPVPSRPGGPPLLIGGSSRGAARRAARIGDGFEPSSPELASFYADEVARSGRAGVEPQARLTSCQDVKFLHVAEDPEAAWARIGPFALHEMNSYAAWTSRGTAKAPYSAVADVAALRRTGMYRVLSPAETVEYARNLPPGRTLELHPLMGGMDPDLGWECLELCAREVLPRLRDGGADE